MEVVRSIFFKDLGKLSDWFLQLAEKEKDGSYFQPNHKATITKEISISKEVFISFTSNLNNFNFFESYFDGRGFDHCLEVKMEEFNPYTLLLIIEEDGTKYLGVRQVYFQSRARKIGGK